ncbi:hypothetical protein FRAAL3062 [Frankia alni ACN14a]|uniref:Uncharacterized protein n=1 Tax=Frankia alni (strain DSM 45986 / CECT 9034 / ACN14a) TaxID=326424 RepID=Q0RL99_FRAAA|nr:hypothetical protein FRAAL3062 [Frankia alni ACN14a]
MTVTGKGPSRAAGGYRVISRYWVISRPQRSRSMTSKAVPVGLTWTNE